MYNLPYKKIKKNRDKLQKLSFKIKNIPSYLYLHCEYTVNIPWTLYYNCLFSRLNNLL